MSAPRVPLNFFGMPFGFAGLAGAWLEAAHQGHAPVAVGNTLCALAGIVWVVVLAGYCRYALSTKGGFGRDLSDAVAAPFASLAVVTPMLLAAQGVAPYAETTGKVLVDLFLTLTVLLGGWFTGQWIYGSLELDRLHPGYFLPTVAGGLVASASAGDVGQIRLSEVMLGLGLICWLILGSMIMFRLFFRPSLPGPLLPTLAIEVAPAAVASLAYFSLTAGRIDAFSAALGGYGLLMVLAQIRLLPVFLRLPFTPSFWAFTFSWAAVASAALRWNDYGRPPGHLVYTYLLLAAATVLIGGIAVRTLLAAKRGQLFPATAVPTADRPSPAPVAG
ncbi:TDT family transporter [Streptacidiphilus sp. 4-A2]|nr:TDT family transporter [Streptacidiphilus sp. 4-A2]